MSRLGLGEQPKQDESCPACRRRLGPKKGQMAQDSRKRCRLAASNPIYIALGRDV